MDSGVALTSDHTLQLMRGRVALMRPVPRSLVTCQLEFQPRQAVDFERAGVQQQAYAQVLRQLGRDVVWIDSDEAFPDCCYIEDAAVVHEDLAIVTRPARESRRGEIVAVDEWLKSHGYRTVSVGCEGTLEGGDVLRAGDRMFVGLSSRSTVAGLTTLQAAMRDFRISVEGVPVVGALHLKTACSYVGRDTFVAVKECLPGFDEWAHGFRQILLSRDEMTAANMLRCGEVVVMPAGWPRVRREIEKTGIDVVEVDLSEHHKAEAGVTCLSILL